MEILESLGIINENATDIVKSGIDNLANVSVAVSQNITDLGKSVIGNCANVSITKQKSAALINHDNNLLEMKKIESKFGLCMQIAEIPAQICGDALSCIGATIEKTAEVGVKDHRQSRWLDDVNRSKAVS